MNDPIARMMAELAPKWDQNDYQMAEEVRQTMQTPGWKHIARLFESQKEAIWQTARRARKEDVVWRLIGVMEGHEITASIPAKILEEAEKQRAIEKKNYEENKMRTDDFSMEAP